MSDAPARTEGDAHEWPATCPTCGTRMKSATVDFNESKADRPELRPGEMAAVDYCPNPDCPDNKPETGGSARPE